ncbi:unnamed protein product [Ixodes pacificus]
MFSNRVLVRAATESTLTTAERTALWDVITGRLNAEGPAWKERVEGKNLWNARVCAARKHDGLLAVEAARTGGEPTRWVPSTRLRPGSWPSSGGTHRGAAVAYVPGSPSRRRPRPRLHCQQSFSTKRRAWGCLQRCRFSRPASQLLQEVDSRLLILVNRN